MRKRSMLVNAFHLFNGRSCLYIYALTAAKEGKRVVVIGSSFISMEIVVAIAQRKLASIDVIGMEEFPFEAVLGKAVGAGIKKACHNNITQ